MAEKDYQAPKVLILLLESKDVVTISEGLEENEKYSFDKGVEDFFFAE